MKVLLPALGCLWIVAFGSAARASDQVSPDTAILESCITGTGNKPIKGIEQFRQDCPELERAIRDLGYDQQLGEDWEHRLNRDVLAGLVHLAKRFAGEPPGAGPDVAALGEALQSLTAHDAPQSWWQRFKAWLRSWLRSPEARSTDNAWLTRLLGRIHLPRNVALTINYLAIAALLALALWIVLRELRAAGVLARGPGRRAPTITGQPRGNGDTGSAGTAADMTAVQRLPSGQQPAALLAVLVQALRQAGRLGLERALTHRELVERAVFDQELQRTRFQRVAQLAERQLYAAHAPGLSNAPESELAQALSEGIRLHFELAAQRSGGR